MYVLSFFKLADRKSPKNTVTTIYQLMLTKNSIVLCKVISNVMVLFVSHTIL